ncbi:hypothetical protein MO867_22235 [Microbulbifer sp. OS29]|uniref:Uncharacterized protein n=1 Tax=Microbulbifer okhotskensis TaxID=2926617 RepID=A0A9X2ESK9_9GAMM|nr:hypothetical protein [Microbulbifer okhotskensis]MCO1337046.1 hypothetical protein [Microbulbifer okhotskensis]
MTDQRSYISVCVVAVIGALVVACHSFTTPHENFKKHMEFNIGRKVDDPASYLNRYPSRVINARNLPNKNIEIEYFSGYKGLGDCTVYFEVDSQTQEIIAWRFVGSEETCIVVP